MIVLTLEGDLVVGPNELHGLVLVNVTACRVVRVSVDVVVGQRDTGAGVLSKDIVLTAKVLRLG